MQFGALVYRLQGGRSVPALQVLDGDKGYYDLYLGGNGGGGGGGSVDLYGGESFIFAPVAPEAPKKVAPDYGFFSLEWEDARSTLDSYSWKSGEYSGSWSTHSYEEWSGLYQQTPWGTFGSVTHKVSLIDWNYFQGPNIVTVNGHSETQTTTHSTWNGVIPMLSTDQLAVVWEPQTTTLDVSTLDTFDFKSTQSFDTLSQSVSYHYDELSIFHSVTPNGETTALDYYVSQLDTAHYSGPGYNSTSVHQVVETSHMVTHVDDGWMLKG